MPELLSNVLAEHAYDPVRLPVLVVKALFR
jgi:hypothetical protein